MSFRVISSTVILTSLLCTGASLHSADSQSPVLTSGAVALLGKTLDAPALEQVRRALSDDDSNVRAVAARLTGVTMQTSLTDALTAAWAKEGDPIAAAEQARALLLIHNAKAAPAIEARLEVAQVAIVYADWILRNKPERYADIIPRLRAAFVGDWLGLNSYTIAVITNRPDLAESVLRASLQATAPRTWRSLLNRLPGDGPRPGQDSVIIEALSSSNAEIRDVTVWSLIGRLGDGETIAPAVLDAAQSFAPAGEGENWERFGREVIARRFKHQETPDSNGVDHGRRAKTPRRQSKPGNVFRVEAGRAARPESGSRRRLFGESNASRPGNGERRDCSLNANDAAAVAGCPP